MSVFDREKSSLSVVMMGHVLCCFLQPFFGVDIFNICTSWTSEEPIKGFGFVLQICKAEARVSSELSSHWVVRLI